MALTSAIARQPVEISFALGWHVAELRWLRPNPAPAAAPGAQPLRLPFLNQVSNLPFGDRLDLLKAQIEAGIAGTGLPAGSPTGIPAYSLAGVVATPDRTDFAGGTVAAIETQLHWPLLATLHATDFRLGKAYELGVGLGETALVGYKACVDDLPDISTIEALGELFAEQRVDRLVRQLRDLKSSFQDYASDAVQATLADWGTWVRGKLSDQKVNWKEQGNGCLYPQAQLWRSVLSGEKDPRDELRVGDYVGALSNLIGEYWKFAASFLRGPLGLALGVVTLVLGVLTVVLAVSSQLQNAIIAVTGFLGALGISGAAITASAKSALTEAEGRLWEAELSAAIGAAISKVPPGLTETEVARLRGGGSVPPPWRRRMAGWLLNS